MGPSDIGLSDFFSKTDGSGRQKQQNQETHNKGLSFVNLDHIVSSEGAEHLKPVIQAIYNQESGGGKNATTSSNGARGGMQVMPGTFRQYAKPGESIDNPEDNMRVGVRIIKDLGNKFGNDPAKIAAGYFSGEGNVSKEHGRAFKKDHADANGKRVSGYVGDILSTLGMVSDAHAEELPATEKPDLNRAPAWPDIVANPEFNKLSSEQQAAAKQAYFNHYIKPHAGSHANNLLQQFMSASNEPRDRTMGEVLSDTGVQLAEGVNNILGAVPNLVSPEGSVAEFFNQNSKFWQDKQSDPLKARIAKADAAIQVADQDGVMAQIAEAAGQYFSDPALAARFIVTNLPSMIPGIAAAKVTQAAALARGASAAKAGSLATTAAGATGAVLNAGGARGEAFNDIKDTLVKQGMSPDQAEEEALKDSRVSAAVGGLAGFVSGKTGLENSLFGQGTSKNAVKAFAKGAAAELGGEQLEEVAPKVTTNYLAGQYDNRNLGQDVGRTIVETGIASSPGATFSGGVSAANTLREQEQPEQQPVDPQENTQQAQPEAQPEETPEPSQPQTDASEHPTVQAANNIARDLAEKAGIPDEVVLPKSPISPENLSEKLNQNASFDKDVLNFAEGRLNQLLEKRDGHIQTGIGDNGISDQVIEGQGLSPQEQQELDALQSLRGNVSGIKDLYGLNPQPMQEEKKQEQVKKSNPVDSAPVSDRSDEDLRQQMRNANDNSVRNAIAEELRKRDREKADREASDKLQVVADEQKKKTDETGNSRVNDQAEKAQETVRHVEAVHQAVADEVNAAAHEAATSPENNRPEPTEAQKQAGNYKKGHINFDGLDISVENPAGSTRSGTDRNGKPWSVDMTAHYGYLRRSEGADGDQVDVYVPENPVPGSPVYVFDQFNHDGKFDEHKAVVGVPTLEAAQQIYDAHFSDGTGPQRRRGVTAMSDGEFKNWAQSGDTSKPLSKPKNEREAKERRKPIKTDADTGNRSDKNPQEKPKTEKEAKARRSKQKEISNGTQANETKQDEAQGTAETATPKDPDVGTEQQDTSLFAKNKIFTADKVAAARARLKSKLNTLNSGIDPELLQDGMTLAGAYIESGFRTFGEYSDAMIQDLGEKVRPYLRSFYEAVRHYPGLDTEGMTASEELDLMERGEGGNIKEKLPLEKTSEQPQDTNQKQEEGNAILNQTESVPAGNIERDTEIAATGNADSKPLDAGVAENSESADSNRGVSGGAKNPGRRRAKSTEPAGIESPVELGESRGDGADASTASTELGSGRGSVEQDHSIDAEEIGKGGLAKKYRDNVDAIKILKATEAEGRKATPQERKALAKYVGWGAMKGPFDSENKAWEKQHAELKELLTDSEYKAARASTRNAHYTSPVAVEAMYSALQHLGFKGGRLLEPSLGVGNFFGLMPKDLRDSSQLHGVELDPLTSRLAAALYPKAKIAQSTGFEDFDIPAEYFDVVIGNPPFGNEPLVDKERSAYSGFSIHNYFLAKSIDKLRPGGIMAVVVSHNFMDAQDGRVRKWIGERASLIGGARLPNTAFKENAGTEVVTDILVFHKNDPANPGRNAAPWQDVVDQTNINQKTDESVTHKVNQLFASQPQFVLGKPSAAGKMYSANEYTVESTGDIGKQLSEWVDSLPKNIFTSIARTNDPKSTDMAVPDGIKVGSFYVDASGKVLRRGTDVMGEKTAEAWQPKSEAQLGRMKGMIAIRDTLRTQMRLELSPDATHQEIEDNRAELNRVYDDFIKKYKFINTVTNRGIFLDDTEAHLIQGLEFDYDRGISKTVAEKEGIEPKAPSANKADIFKRRVAFPPQDFMKVSTAKDALLASLNYRGGIDLPYMAEVYGKSPEDIVQELGDVVFDDPQSGIVAADEYLSGDVKTKLREARAAAQSDKKYNRNVEALEKVIPKDKTPSEISVSIGASFVPPDVYQQFVKHISGVDADVSYIKATGQWVTAHNNQGDTALNTAKFGTSELPAVSLFQLTMLGRGAVVKKTVRNGDGSTTTYVLEKETEAAREKQNAIKAEWQKWLWQDAERADKIASIYNDKMNRIVPRKYDGSHMSFPGMNPSIELIDHQKNGVWRGLQSYQVLYDHVVGAGKTFLMTTLAMEMRRLGIARKPFFAVPNHLTLQWMNEFTRLYPGSNVLAATPEDFSKDNRERMFAKIITGDWDAVIVGHSSMKKIGLPPETESAVLQEQIDELAAAIEEMKRSRGDRRIVADMERIRKNLEAKMKDKLAAIGERSKVVTFDELGVDAMMIDEMHEFKNLAYHTTMDRNPGMGNPAGSSKAFDLFVKTQWLFNTFGDKTPYVTATGTPVSNSLVEMFNMQRYMQYSTLKQEGLNVFDAWAKQFGSVENVYEVAPSGSGYRQSTRFAKFTNLPALMSLYNTFADTVTLDDLKAQEEARGKRFPVPKVSGGRPTLIVAKRSPAVAELMGVPRAQVDDNGNIEFSADLNKEITIQHDAKSDKYDAYIGDSHIGKFDTEQDARLKVAELALSPVVSVNPNSIVGRFADLRRLTRDTKGKVNALSLTGEANKAGLDYRLINPSAPDFPGSKINMAVDNMTRIYKQWQSDRGTQLVFCDLSVPLSARSNFSNTPRRLYVRNESGALDMKRGTMHTMPGHEDLPYFIVQRGSGKDSKRFDVYDAASGAVILTDSRSKQDAMDSANGMLSDDAERANWIFKRESAGEIEQEAIDDLNNENEVETENLEFFAREDIAGMSAATKFSVYDDIKKKMIAKGVPEHEIAFIHDYSTPVAKSKLFKAVNDGQIRFLLGSTPKMGAGTNVQKRLVGLHHIDAPWRPSDLEQREGRIIRRGNELYERDPDGFEVFIGRYATEQTYDTRRWQILEHKARGIEQLRNYDGTINEIEDIDGEAANAADMKAAASGDPLILEETRLRNEVRRLERLQAAHADEVLAMTRKARDAEYYAKKTAPSIISEAQGLLDEAKKHKLDSEGFSPIAVQGRKPKADKEAAYKELASAFNSVREHIIDTADIQYRGIDFRMEHFAGSVVMRTPTGNSGVWVMSDAFSPSGMVQRMKNYIDRLPDTIENAKARAEKSVKDAAALREQAKQPFQQAGDLEKTREEHKRVQRALMAKGPQVPDEQKAALAAGIEDQKSRLRALGYGDALDELLSNNNDATVLSTTNDADPIPEENWLSVGVFAQTIEDRIGQFRHQPPVIVLDRITDIPNMRQASAGSVAGLTTGGKIYIFRDANATTADITQTLWHELLHYGLRRFLTKEQYIAETHRLYDRDLWIKRRADQWVDGDGADVKQAKRQGMAYARARGVDEALAELAEINEGGYRNNDLLAKVRRTVLRWIAAIAEKFGFHDVATRFRSVAHDEARNLVREMFQKLRENAPATSMDNSFKASTAFSFSRTVDETQNNIFKFFGNPKRKSPKNFGAYHKTLSTQYHKALTDQHYGKVFSLANAMQNHVSLASIRPSELAPGVLPRVDDVKSAAKGLFKGAQNQKYMKKVADAIFAGTLAGRGATDGRVWDDTELKNVFGLDETGISLYRQARASVDASIDELAAAEGYAMAQHIVPKDMRRMIIDEPGIAGTLLKSEVERQANVLNIAIQSARKRGDDAGVARLEALQESYASTLKNINTIFDTAAGLKKGGYAPLMRFGKWTVTAQEIDPQTGAVERHENGGPETVYFGKFDTESEAMAALDRTKEKYKGRKDIRVYSGIDSEDSHQLYAGISPETVALFGEAIGAGDVANKYYQIALSERSALKRRLERKGTPGYSEDLPRVLSNFITSNGRFSAQRYYLRDLNESIRTIPKDKGDVKDEAIQLKQFIINPGDPAAPLSTVMFAWFLGGSVAAAMVNMTQPVMMTGPYLSQFGLASATAELTKAIPFAMGKKEIADKNLRDALQRASREGVVDAQEIFHLYSMGAQSIASGLIGTLSRIPGTGKAIKAGSDNARARINAFLTLWGSMFSLAEKFNRKLTFIAAWNMAKEKGNENPYAFAVRAVNETQGIYNKVNRPNWARNPVGRTILTFKQFSLMYVEMLSRMWKRGGPEGKRAALIMLAVLMLAAGEEGLPFAQDLDDLIDTVGQLFGLDTNMRRNKREAAYQILGDKLGDMFLYGLSSQMPLDVSGRLGLGNFIPGTGLLKKSDEQMRTRNAIELLGPAAGMGSQIGDAYDAATEGNSGKALQNLAPKAIKDILAAEEMVRKGYSSDFKGRKVTDVGLSDAAIKATGFNPTKIAQVHRKTMPLQQDISLQKITETSIANQWVRGVIENDDKMVDEAKKRQDEWNKRNPRIPIAINSDQIRDRIRSLATDKNTRILKDTPKEMRGRIGLELIK